MSLSFFTSYLFRLWAVAAWLKLLNLPVTCDLSVEPKSELFIDLPDILELIEYLEFLEPRREFEEAFQADWSAPKSKDMLLLWRR